MPTEFKKILLAQAADFSDAMANSDFAEVYQDSELVEMLSVQKDRGEESTVIFTDVDHTFYRDNKTAATALLTKLTQANDWPLAAITGCGYEGILKRIEQGGLPYFQLIAGSVGTEIWVLNYRPDGTAGYRRDLFFDKLLRQSGFDRRQLWQRSYQMIADLKRQHLQWQFNWQHPKKEQAWRRKFDPDYQPFKISFHFFADSDRYASSVVAAAVKRYFPDQAVITCGEIGYNAKRKPGDRVKKYCLDVLPTSKSGALAYWRTLLGVTRGIVAGDSGNDIDMLLESGSLNAVLVGGYEPMARTAIEYASSVKPHQVIIEHDTRRQAAESILQVVKRFLV